MKMAARKSDDKRQTFVFAAMFAIVAQFAVSPYANAVELMVVGAAPGDRSSDSVYICDTESPADADNRIPAIPLIDGTIDGIPYGISFGPDAYYVAAFEDERVLRFDKDGNSLDQAGALPDLPDGLKPTNIVVGPAGLPYVVASNAANQGTVLLYDKRITRGSPYVPIVAAGLGGFTGAEDIVLGPLAFWLYVSSKKTHEVLRYSLRKRGVWQVFVATGGEENLRGPRGLFIHDGVLYVASSDNDQILKYDSDTGEFLDVFACNTNPGRVTCVDSGGDYRGPAEEELNVPIGLTRAGPDGNIFVSAVGTGTGDNAVIEYDINTGEVENTCKGISSTGYLVPRAYLVQGCIDFKGAPMAGTVTPAGSRIPITLDDQGCFAIDKVVDDTRMSLTTVKK